VIFIPPSSEKACAPDENVSVAATLTKPEKSQLHSQIRAKLVARVLSNKQETRVGFTTVQVSHLY